MESTKVFHVKKAKKKQVKDELDRIKQAEKKRRRLEKALATSAAIRFELEKKKEKKKEEEQRLDQEGAAIAEAVALHVLLEEDSDEKSRILLKEQENFTENIGLFMNGSTFETGGWFSANFAHMSDTVGANQGLSCQHHEENFNLQCSWDGGAWCPHDISVSSLQIGEGD